MVSYNNQINPARQSPDSGRAVGQMPAVAGAEREIVKMQLTISTLILCLGYTVVARAQRIERQFIVNAIRIKLSTDQPVVPINDAVVVKFTITNTSKVELPIAGSFDWTVRREDGSPVANTPEGVRRREAKRATRSLSVPLYLAPGASSNQEETLSKLFVMDVPGVYLVSMRIGVTDEIRTDFIESNTLRITVK